MHFRDVNHSGSPGHVLRWYFKVEKAVLSRDSFRCSRIKAVLSGHVIGLLSGLSAAAHICSGRLVPLLTAQTTDHMVVPFYYGNRTAQSRRVRAFIDLGRKAAQKRP